MFIHIDTTAHEYQIVQCHASAYNFGCTHIKLLVKIFIPPIDTTQTPVYGSITNIAKDDVCEVSKSTLHLNTIISIC